MKKLFTTLCALGIGTASAQTFRAYEDATFSGSNVFKFVVPKPSITTQPARLWAVVNSTTTANVTLTWAHAGLTFTKPNIRLKGWGFNVFQADTSDLLGTKLDAEWSLTVTSDKEVTLQNWGVDEMPKPLPLARQYCQAHGIEGTITMQRLFKSRVESSVASSTALIVYKHDELRTRLGAVYPACTWPEMVVTTYPPQAVKSVNKKDK